MAADLSKQETPALGTAHDEHVRSSVQKDLTTDDAAVASSKEHEQTLKEAFRSHWKAALWSMAISLTIVMEGYDYGLMPAFFGYPSFTKRFGEYFEGNDTYQLSASWQAGLLNGTHSCVMIGSFINGWASSRWGYRRVMQVALTLLTGFIFVPFFATRIEILLIGQMLCGLTWGVFATTGPAYASEVCPLRLRGILTIYVNLCWSMGNFVMSGVLEGTRPLNNDMAWRIPVALQWMWPLPILAALFFAPESPWWLARNGKLDEAEKSLMRLSTHSREECQATLAQIQHTNELEDKCAKESSYLECFRGINRRRTEICMVVFLGQQLSGAVMADTPTYFFLQAGVPDSQAYKINIGATGMSFIGTICSMVLISFFGRRTLYGLGMATLAICLLLVGVIASVSDSQSAQWAQVAFVFVWKLVYSLTVGPICYAIISETSAVRLRGRTVVIARNTYAVGQIVCNTINPLMLNPTEWDWKGQAGFFWFGTGALAATWAYFRLPETRDRTYAELDSLFQRKISARKFSKTVVEPHEHNSDSDLQAAEKTEA